MRGDTCELCGKVILGDYLCLCIERSPDELVTIVGIKEGDIINSPVFGKLIVRGIGFRVPECNEVVKDPFLQLAVYWVEYSDGFKNWMDLYLNDMDSAEFIQVNGWVKFLEITKKLYPSSDKNKIITFIEKIASNEFRKNIGRDEFAKQDFFALF